jgi:hypothetical protein
MKKKVIKLNEDSIERIVRRIIKEEDVQNTENTQSNTENTEKETIPLTQHDAYPLIGELTAELGRLRTTHLKDILDLATGHNGFQDDMDSIETNFLALETKLVKLKKTISTAQVEVKSKQDLQRKKEMSEKKQRQYRKREEAYGNGDKYSY